MLSLPIHCSLRLLLPEKQNSPRPHRLLSPSVRILLVSGWLFSVNWFSSDCQCECFHPVHSKQRSYISWFKHNSNLAQLLLRRFRLFHCSPTWIQKWDGCIQNRLCKNGMAENKDFFSAQDTVQSQRFYFQEHVKPGMKLPRSCKAFGRTLH